MRIVDGLLPYNARIILGACCAEMIAGRHPPSNSPRF